MSMLLLGTRISNDIWNPKRTNCILSFGEVFSLREEAPDLGPVSSIGGFLIACDLVFTILYELFELQIVDLGISAQRWVDDGAKAQRSDAASTEQRIQQIANQIHREGEAAHSNSGAKEQFAIMRHKKTSPPAPSPSHSPAFS